MAALTAGQREAIQDAIEVAYGEHRFAWPNQEGFSRCRCGFRADSPASEKRHFVVKVYEALEA